MIDTRNRSVRAAYDAASTTWGRGPNLVYGRLAEVLLDFDGPVLDRRRVLDLGAGPGTAAAMVRRRGGWPLGLDASFGMAGAVRRAGMPAVQGDAYGLPFRTGSFDVAVAAFVLNHLVDPAAALREVRRTLVAGGILLASTFAPGPEHPVKAAVDDAARAVGWRQPPWHLEIKAELADRVGDAAALAAMAERAGFAECHAETRTVMIEPLDATSLIEYRLGMGNLADFVIGLEPAARRLLVADAARRLGSPVPPLCPAVLLFSARVPTGPRPPA